MGGAGSSPDLQSEPTQPNWAEVVPWLAEEAPDRRPTPGIRMDTVHPGTSPPGSITVPPSAAAVFPWRSIFDHADCGLVVYDRTGAIQAVNQQACALLGHTESELLGRTSFDPRWFAVDPDGHIIPPEQYPGVQARDTGEAVRDVLLGVVRPLTGERAWLQASAVPRTGMSGEVEGVVLTLVDVTATQQEAMRHAAEKRLRTEMMRTAPAGILVLDRDDRIRHASNVARRLLGLPLEGDGPFKLRGTLVDSRGDGLSPDELPAHRVRTADRPLIGARYVWTSRSGRRRIFMVNGARLDTELWPDGIVLSFNDVTQQEATARAIRQSERRLSAALNAADLGRFVLDIARRCVSVDRNWMARHAFPPQLAESDYDLWRARLERDDVERLVTAIDAHERGETKNLEVEFWLRAESKRARLRVTGLIDARDESGRALQLSGVLMDVTAAYEAEQAAKALEVRAAEMARLEGIAAVAGGVAHTFSNLLVGVMGAVHSAREGIDDHTPLAEALDLIAEAATRAGDVTTQLRAVSGHSRFSLQRIRLDDLVRSARGMLETGLADRAVLRTEAEGTAQPVEVDVDQLKLVLMNLVLNAADAIPDSRQLVTVRTGMVRVGEHSELPGLASPGQPGPGAYVVVEVVDRGHGMPPHVQRRMFEPFFSTRPHRQGLGLGAVLGVARGHGGFVQVRSFEGVGTTVCIGLPVAEDATTPELPARRNTSPDSGRRVLVVDDESIIRRLVTKVLDRAGYDVVTAEDGHGALDVLEAEAASIGLLLLDLTMPEMSGREVLQVVLDRWPDLSVLVMSGYTEDEMVGRLLADGKVSFLSKPFGAGDLRDAVAAFLAPARATT